MRKRGNYKFLDKFSWYIPGVGGMFGLLAWLLVGALLGGINNSLLFLNVREKQSLCYYCISTVSGPGAERAATEEQ